MQLTNKKQKGATIVTVKWIWVYAPEAIFFSSVFSNFIW